MLNKMLDHNWDADRARAKLNMMDQVIFRAADHVRVLLSFAHKERMEVKPVPLAPLVKETLRMAKDGVPENIRLEISVAGDGLTVNTDATQLQQALLNLINNAVDALEGTEDDPVIRVEAECVETDGERRASITVTDNGCGMPEHVVEKACDPYFTTKSPGKGTGLGLAMVSGMVDQCKGTFSIESRKGKGTTVRLCLPLEKSEQESFMRDIPKVAEAVPVRNACVLLADDDDDVRETMAEALRVMDFTVLTAKNGREALQLFLSRRNEIHAVVLDMVMPEMGGVKAARRLREVKSALPIVLMTGYDINGQAKAACDEGVCERVINKPVPPGQLVGLLQSMLGG